MLKEGINKIENIKGNTDGQTWRRMKRIQLWCMNTRWSKEEAFKKHSLETYLTRSCDFGTKSTVIGTLRYKNREDNKNVTEKLSSI